MKSNQKEIKQVNVGSDCMESKPCLHQVRLIYKDGTQEEKGLDANEIIHLYTKYLGDDMKKHLRGEEMITFFKRKPLVNTKDISYFPKSSTCTIL